MTKQRAEKAFGIRKQIDVIAVCGLAKAHMMGRSGDHFELFTIKWTIFQLFKTSIVIE